MAVTPSGNQVKVQVNPDHSCNWKCCLRCCEKQVEDTAHKAQRSFQHTVVDTHTVVHRNLSPPTVTQMDTVSEEYPEEKYP